MSELIHVTGMRELQEFLNTLPLKIQRNVMRGALRAGAKVIMQQAKAMAPVAAPGGNAKRKGGYAGALRDSIRIKTGSKRGSVTATITAGGNKKADVYYAQWVEFGTAAHRIKAKKGGVLSFAGGAYEHVNHPGARPHPFMRPAMDASASDAVVAAAQYVKERLSSQQGLNTADVEIEHIEAD